MANQRIVLWALLGLTLWLCYEAWMKDYRPATPAVATSSAPSNSGAAPVAPVNSFGDSVPGLTAAKPAAAPDTVAAATNNIPDAATPAQSKVHVLTDVLDLDIDLAGGTMLRADLLMYPKEKKDPNVKVRLFDDTGEHPYLFQSGLTAQGGESQPNHLAHFTAPANEYRLAEGQDVLTVPLTWTDASGLTVTKTFTFRRSHYAIGVDYDVDNQTGQDWHGASYMRFLRHYQHTERSMLNVASNVFKGPAIWDGAKYEKLNIEDEEDAKFSQTITNGWLASMEHHFVGAVVPPAGQAYQYKLEVNPDLDYLMSAVGPAQTVAAGQRKRISEQVFVGPKLQNQLEELNPELDRTADYGYLYFLAKPLFTVLEFVHSWVGNWGWTIVIVTFLLKLVFYPLSETSGRSMAKMRLLAPRIKNIQERYKDNREQLGRAMMDIYKREKVNPLAGCLPMLVQIPVFLAFYWTLLESVEMRQAPFILWINDLSSKDPFFILPLLMGAGMFAQFKLNPAPPDPMQAKIFMIMPVVMTVMFAFFPAGLVLYWFTNTLLSILQQWNINRRIEAAGKKPAAA